MLQLRKGKTGKYITLFFLGLMLFWGRTTMAQMRQVYQDTFQANNHILKISMYSSTEGYIAFENYIGFTTDSGRNFSKKYITSGNVDFGNYSVNLTFGFNIEGIKAFNKDTIIAFGDYGLVPAILFSSNQGNSFKLVFHSQFNSAVLATGVKDMVFPANAGTGYAVDADRILKTVNSGLSWSVASIAPGSYFTNLEAVSNNYVLAFSKVYSLTKLFRTQNGTSWTGITVPGSGPIYYAQFLTAGKGWLCRKNTSSQGILWYTADNGASWIAKTDPVLGEFYSQKLHFIDDSTGYALAGYKCFKTTDSGRTWEPLPRDNDFSYPGYGHTDLSFISNNQFWAGGGHGFLEITTNHGGIPLPKAFFKVDSTGVYATGLVKLQNYSKPGYQYKWFRNDSLFATSYNCSYLHDLNLSDTLKLIVSNGQYSDTAIHYATFSPPVVINSFSPAAGDVGTLITILGSNFAGAVQVSFGGVNAYQFTVVSSTKITAYVGFNGGVGSVKVFTDFAVGARAGFTGYPYPAAALPVAIADSILCKSEPVSLSIQNSEANVQYELIDSLNTSMGSATSSGGTFTFSTNPLSKTGYYRVRVTRPGSMYNTIFNQKKYVVVEHTKSRFYPGNFNTITGQPVIYTQQSTESSSFIWNFYQDASIVSSNMAIPPPVIYTSPGQKTIQLISSSTNGCIDTAAGNAAFIYTKPLPDASCYALNISDSNYAWVGYSTTNINQVTLCKDNGYIISGKANKVIVNSLVGAGKSIPYNGTTYMAKFTTDGMLIWTNHIPTGGYISATATDNAGNIYVAGYIAYNSWFVFSNGDSMRLSVTSSYSANYSVAQEFIMKLDASGRYIWHSIIYDPGPIDYIYSREVQPITKIAIRDNHIVLLGNFNTKLSFSHNGNTQPLFDFDVTDSRLSIQNTFILKIDRDGGLVWRAFARNIATNGYGTTDASIDKNGNSYLVGFYEESVKIHDANLVERASLTGTNSRYGGYLVKYDSLGNIIWHNKFRTHDTYGSCQLVAVETDSSGNSYVLGQVDNLTNDSLIISNSNGTIAADSLTGFMVQKFNSDGIYKWGSGCRKKAYGRGFSVTLKDNAIYVLASLSLNNSQVSSFTITSTDSRDKPIVLQKSDFMLARYDTSGVLQRLDKSGPNRLLYDDVTPNKLVLDAGNNFIISGRAGDLGVRDHYVFNSTFKTNLEDGFFAKISPGYCGNGSVALCAGGNGTLDAGLAGLSYHWQVNTGSGFIDVVNNSNHSGAATSTLQLLSIPSSWAGYQYRCVVDQNNNTPIYTLKFENYFTAAASSAWENPANWSCGRIPDASTDVTIGSSTVVLSSFGTCRTITVKEGAVFRVAQGYRLTITH